MKYLITLIVVCVAMLAMIPFLAGKPESYHFIFFLLSGGVVITAFALEARGVIPRPPEDYY